MPDRHDEAYLLGLLLARGSVGPSDRFVAGTRPYGKFTIRIPLYKYWPDGVAIIKALVESSGALSSSEIRELSPILRTRPGASSQAIGRSCVRLRSWHPISLVVRNPLLTYADEKWKINDRRLASRFLSEQSKYLDRNFRSQQFVIEHLNETLRAFGPNIDNLGLRPGFFNVDYLVVDCHVPPVEFERITESYGLAAGDVYKYSTLPPAVESFTRAEKLEFVRGLADAAGHFDLGPPWYGDGETGLWQVRLAFLAESPPQLCVQVCNFLEERIELPVLSINWVSGDMPKKKNYRGGRDRHVIIWAVNIRKHFEAPFFYNEWKEEELERCLSDDYKTLSRVKRHVKRPRQSNILNMLTPCNRTPKLMPYMVACRTYGCPRRYAPENTPRLESYLK